MKPYIFIIGLLFASHLHAQHLSLNIPLGGDIDEAGYDIVKSDTGYFVFSS